MRTKVKQCLLVLCLFLFLFVVIGGGLHLNPGGALVAALTGTPLVVYVFHRRPAPKLVEPEVRSPREADGAVCRAADGRSSEVGVLEVENAARH